MGNKLIKILIISLFWCKLSYARTYTFCYEDKEQFPNYLGDTDVVPQNNLGVCNDIIKRVAEEMKIDIKFVRYPWKRCLLFLADNSVDGVFNASFSEERLNFGAYPMLHGKPDSSKRITTISYAFYTLRGLNIQYDKKNKQFINLPSIAAAQLGFSIVNDLKKMGLSVNEFPSSLQVLENLAGNKIKLAAIQTITAQSYIRKYPDKFTNIVELLPYLSTKDYYVMFNHKIMIDDPQFAEMFWNTLKIIREKEGQVILNKYLK